MSHQRKRGLTAKVWAVEAQEDNRGNKTKVPANEPFTVKVWVMPERGSRAEVPGQQKINILRIGTAVRPDIDFWSRVELLGSQWDVVSPPEYHHGTPNTRHYSMALRERP